MWVCICNAVAARDVHSAIEAGASTRDAVTAACGAGGDCGACHPMIEEMLDAHRHVIEACKLVRHRAA